MPEDVETVAADSSPAASSAPAPDAKPEIPKDPEAYAEWRTTGKLPEPKSADDKSGKAAPVSETGSQRKERSGEERKEELKRDIQELLAQRSQLRSEVNGSGKTDAPKAESSPAPTPAKSDVKEVKAESSPAPATEDGRPKKPKLEDFNNDWAAYEAAQDKYIEDVADWRAAAKIRENEARRQQAEADLAMQRRLDAAKERYGEGADVRIVDTARTITGDKEVAFAIKAAVGRSKVLVDALYVMSGDQKQFAEFIELAKKDPLEALRKWYKVEELVEAQVAKNTASEPDEETPAPRSPDGKFLPQRKAREAPAPRTELGGTSSPPGDERTRAAAHGDFRTFKQDADRRELARLRGQ